LITIQNYGALVVYCPNICFFADGRRSLSVLSLASFWLFERRSSRSVPGNQAREEVDLAAIRYLVKDVDRSIAFYTELLAFKVAHQAKPAFASVARDDLAAEGAE
jgi:hypothetical protein